jgi:hypothetical protein
MPILHDQSSRRSAASVGALVALLLTAVACAPGLASGSAWPASVAAPAGAWVCGEAPLAPAYEPTLFVATGGDDGASGRSVDAPFRTLQRAVDEAGPGDVVWVRGGVYGSDVEIRRSGQAGRPIVVESYPGECAVFDGTGLEPTQRIRLLGVRHVVLRNIEVRNSPSEGVFLMESHDVVISHVRSHHNGNSGILSMLGDRNLFAYVIVHDNVDRPRGQDADGIGISSGDRNRISHCVAYGNSDDGVDTWRSTNTLVERCVSFDNGRLQGDGNGFKLGGANLVVHTVVRDSIAFGNRVDGFDFNSGRGVQLEHNTAFGNGRHGFIVSDGVLRNNLSVGNGASDRASSERGNVLAGNSWTIALGDEVFVSTEPGDPSFLRLVPDSAAVRSGVPLTQADLGRDNHVGALAPGETIASAWRLSSEPLALRNALPTR